MAMSGALQRMPLLSVLPPETTALLERRATRRAFRRGQIVFRKGDPGSSMFLIVEGQVKMILPSEGGEEVLLGVLDAGDFFGDLSIIDGQPRSATIVATEPTETVVIRRDEFLGAIDANPRVAFDLLRILARRLRQTDEFVEDAIFLDVRGRLAKKLLELGETYGAVGPGGTVIGIRLTQGDLAAMIGATRESVNKHLRSYRARGIIDIAHQRITIRRVEELRRRIY